MLKDILAISVVALVTWAVIVRTKALADVVFPGANL
jgi:hypothetical protein